METIRLATSDGVSLAGTRFTPSTTASAVVVMPAAMGVKQDFYAPFAQFLAEQGVAVQEPALRSRRSGKADPRRL